MEQKGYRDNLELLNEMFPNVGMLNISEACQAIGVKSVDAVKKRLRFVDRRVSKTEVARYMCGKEGVR